MGWLRFPQVRPEIADRSLAVNGAPLLAPNRGCGFLNFGAFLPTLITGGKWIRKWDAISRARGLEGWSSGVVLGWPRFPQNRPEIAGHSLGIKGVGPSFWAIISAKHASLIFGAFLAPLIVGCKWIQK